jgi:hypothetical protein
MSAYQRDLIGGFIFDRPAGDKRRLVPQETSPTLFTAPKLAMILAYADKAGSFK